MTWHAEEIDVWRPPADLLPSEWIERNRKLPAVSSAESGLYRFSRVPFLREILDRLADPWCREVVLCKPAQIGGTTLFENAIAYRAAEEPGPAMLFLADEGTAIKISRTRIQPMMRDTESLARLIVEGSFTLGEILLANGYNLELGWSSSIAKSASRAVRDLFLDEIDKPGYSIVGEEGSTLHRLRQRTETWADHKIYLSSTPTTEAGNITKELNSCHVIFDWHVPCPQCGAYQPLRWQPTKYRDEHGNERTSGSVVWPGGHEATEAQIGEARYQCGECHGQWGTPEKNNAVERGRWIARGANPPRAAKIGYHLNRLYSLFPGGRLSSLVRGWNEAQGDPMNLRSYVNSVLAEPWQQETKAVKADEVLTARCELARGVVPDEALVLVAFVDVQQDRFWWRIRAFAPDRTSWGIDEGYVMTWPDVERLLFDTEWKRANGEAMRIWRAGIDIGGTRKEGELISRSEETMIWAAANRFRLVGQLFACKGASNQQTKPVKLGEPLDKTPSGKRILKGRQILTIDTAFFKDALVQRREWAAEHLPGAAYLHAETEEWYAKQMAAEVKRRARDGGYEWVRRHPDNHMIDCEVGCFAMVDPGLFGGIERLKVRRPAPKLDPEEPESTSKQQDPPPKRKPNPYLSGRHNRPANPYLTGRRRC